MANSVSSGDDEAIAAGLAVRELSILERDFYTARFEKGQQRGLVIVSTSAALAAAVGAVRALVPSDADPSAASAILLVLSLLAFVAATVIAIVGTGPPWTKSDELPTLDAAEQFGPGGDAGAFHLSTGRMILRQAEGIRGVANKQARAVMLGSRIEAVAVTLLALAVASLIAGDAGLLSLRNA